MVRPKASSKKSQKQRGVDFKKYKRKIGRKLPPPKNATNTEIKSKAIVLPEQSVASEREGLAVSKKGLTLKELLQQTSHHNAKVRKDALLGIRDLTLKHPSELKLHKLVIIEKLRERISDDDKVVRETLYQLFKSVIFPGCKEEIPGPIISLIMAYIFNAMTHLAFDIRLMAFKFFELVVQHYPSSFLLHAEKVLQSYEDILKKSNTYLQDKSRLKNALGGLVRCLSLFPSAEGHANLSREENTDAGGTLHGFELEVPADHTDVPSIVSGLENLIPVLVNCFQELIPSILEKPLVDPQSFECMLCVLQSLDLALRHFVCRSNKCQTDSKVSVCSLDKIPDTTIWRESTLPILLKKLLEVFPLSSIHNPAEKNDERYFVLNVVLAEIFLSFNEWTDTPIPMEKVLDFVENTLSGKICCSTWSIKPVREKHLVSLLHFIPTLILQEEGSWKTRIMQAFTEAFKNCKPESSLKLACLSAIEELLLLSSRCSAYLLDSSDPVILSFQTAWMHELPLLLVQLGDKHPALSKSILHLHLRLGQYVPMGSILSQEFDNLQESFIKFYCTFQEESSDQGSILYGPFIMLPRDCQELAVCSLYYFTYWNELLLKSITYCCLCHSLDPSVIFRMIEVLQSSYRAGHLQIADNISFLVTVLARFGGYSENGELVIENNEKHYDDINLKAIAREIGSCLLQMGDNAIVLHIIEKTIVSELAPNPPLNNMCSMLRVLASLDNRPSLLSEDSIIVLGKSILGYMVDSSSFIPENGYDSTDRDQMHICRYYLVPCFVLFDKSDKLLNHLLSLMGSSVTEDNAIFSCDPGSKYTHSQSNRINAVASILLFMHKDVKLQRSLSYCKAEVRHILLAIISYQSSNNISLSLEERHKRQTAVDELKKVTGRLHCWDADDLRMT